MIKPHLKKNGIIYGLVFTNFFAIYMILSLPSRSPVKLSILFGLFLLSLTYSIVTIIKIKKRSISYLNFLSKNLNIASKDNLQKLNLPVISYDEKCKVLWYNPFFESTIYCNSAFNSPSISDFFPMLSKSSVLNEGEYDVSNGDKQYTMRIIKKLYNNNTVFVAFLTEDTKLKNEAKLYYQNNPCVMNIIIDNLDEALSLAKESTKNQVSSIVGDAIEEIVSSYHGVVYKVSSDKFSAVVSQQTVDSLRNDKFKVFDKIESFYYDTTTPITLSIGVGAGDTNLSTNYTYANQALDMALGRGGDQSVVKTNNDYNFFGESLRSGHKKSKVKSRFMTNAITELINTADNVIIMGHKFADFDSVGSAFGIYRMCKLLKKPAFISIDIKNNLSENLIKYITSKNETKIFISENETLDEITDKTLLIIVDTNSKGLVQFQSVYENCNHIVVIDHHRKVVDFIDDSTIMYHEPTASSASEMVTEMAQYFAMNNKNLDNITSDALLAGISLDTRNFSIRTSVRTFDAASYLRQCGSDTIIVRKFFNQSAEVYKLKNEILANTENFLGCGISFVQTDDVVIRTVAPQSADEMLHIEGIQASFVAFELEKTIHISGRSFGEINVQIILEALGGGGHLTMAGAQLKDVSLTDAIAQLKLSIENYLNK